MSSKKNCGGFSHHTQVGFDKDRPCGDIAEVSNCLGKEVIDLTVDIWDDPGCDGDNVVRVFNEGECTYKDGYFYWSLEDLNVEMPPSAKWSEPSTKCEMLQPTDISGKQDKLTNCKGTDSTGSVVDCAEMGQGLWFNTTTGQWEAVSSSIPTGCQEFVASVSGTFATDLGSDTPYATTSGNYYYEAHDRGVLTYTVDDYPYLATAGRAVCLTLNSNMGYALTDPNDQIGVGANIQTGLDVVINGQTYRWNDGYYMNGDGQDHESGTSNCLCFETDGNDLSIETVRWVRTDITGIGGNVLDYTGTTLYVDVAEITGTFSDGTSITL